jgi:hypothetical protein
MIATSVLAFSTLNWLYLSVSIITFVALLSFAVYMEKPESPARKDGRSPKERT